MRRVAAAALWAITLGTGGVNAFAGEVPTAPESFLNMAAQSGMLEVEAAWAAVTRSKNAAVKEYAYRMIHDHRKMNEDLADIARKRGVTLPGEPDAERASLLKSLRELAPQEFDAQYLATMVVEHARTAELLQSNLLNADVELAVFSSYNLPRIREHGRQAEELKAGLSR